MPLWLKRAAQQAGRQALELTQELVQQMAFFKIAGMAEKAPTEEYSAAVAKVAGSTRHEPARKHASARAVHAKEHEWQEF